MRLEKSEQLIKLALMMQGSTDGIGLQDIERECEVGRRTAERMRDVLLKLFPHIEEIRVDGRKHWRLPPAAFAGLIQISAEELAEMKTAIEILRNNNLQDYATQLDALWLKIKGRLRPERAASIETDLEALLEAEGHAMRPGPRPRINPQVLHILQDAIKGACKVKITYCSRGKKEITERIVHPYGFLYGALHYLIGWCESKKDFRYFSLADIKSISLTNSAYQKNSTFNLEEYTRRSFGVFQEEPYDVVWRFSPGVAAKAREYYFHPTQRIKEEPDGSLLVKFKAGGAKEMCWHLMTWEGEAEIIKPAHLKNTYKAMLTKLQQQTDLDQVAARKTWLKEA
jgi:predicted DNA-binding transcriptional regulator YafY